MLMLTYVTVRSQLTVTRIHTFVDNTFEKNMSNVAVNVSESHSSFERQSQECIDAIQQLRILVKGDCIHKLNTLQRLQIICNGPELESSFDCAADRVEEIVKHYQEGVNEVVHIAIVEEAFEISAYQIESIEGSKQVQVKLKQIFNVSIRNVFSDTICMEIIHNEFAKSNHGPTNIIDHFQLTRQFGEFPFVILSDVVRIQDTKRQVDIMTVYYGINQYNRRVVMDKTNRSIQFKDLSTPPNAVFLDKERHLFQRILRDWIDTDNLIIKDIIYL